MGRSCNLSGGLVSLLSCNQEPDNTTRQAIALSRRMRKLHFTPQSKPGTEGAELPKTLTRSEEHTIYYVRVCVCVKIGTPEKSKQNPPWLPHPPTLRLLTQLSYATDATEAKVEALWGTAPATNCADSTPTRSMLMSTCFSGSHSELRIALK